MSDGYLTSTPVGDYTIVNRGMTSYTFENVYRLYSEPVKIPVSIKRIYLVPFDVLK